MKTHYLIIFSIFLIGACQLEDSNTPKPEEGFIKFYGDLTSFEAVDVELYYDASGENAEGLVIFGTKTTTIGDKDFFILRTDLEGTLLDSISFGFSDTLDVDDDGIAEDLTGNGIKDRIRAQEAASKILPVSGFGYAIVGTSTIEIPSLDVPPWKWLSFAFLDENLNPIVFQEDTVLISVNNGGGENEQLDREGNDIVVLSDGSFLIVGANEISRGGGVIDFDTYQLLVNFTTGIIEERAPVGIPGEGNDDKLIRAFQKENDNIVLIGHSLRPSLLGENSGFNGENVFFLETDPNGTPVNAVAYGLDDPNNNIVYNEVVTDAIFDNKVFTISGTSNTSQEEEYGFVIRLNENGEYLNGNSHDSSTYQSFQNKVDGVVRLSNGDYALLGNYPSFSRTNELNRGVEGMFVRVNEASEFVEGGEQSFGNQTGDDRILDAVTLPDGRVILLATVDFGGGVELISLIKMNPDGSFEQ